MREAERLLMSQSDRIHTAVAAMAPRAGASSMYLVGFSGVGEQKVFAGEISLAAKVFGDRYGTQQRTLLLVNDQRDLESHPLATVTGLKVALLDIGRRMDRERDILTLVISSHGSKDPAISVSNGGLPLNDLTGPDLKRAFDEAGIRWRIVIISACHAGAFIPFLDDDHSIVIAAAAADRTSFGCSNDRDLTNFGEAFVRDSLPNALSLRAAFEKARKSIDEREHAEKLTPSNPTAHFGSAIERKLSALETQATDSQATSAPLSWNSP
jgi:Peptidase C13 family